MDEKQRTFWEIFDSLTPKKQSEYMWSRFGELVEGLVQEWADNGTLDDAIEELEGYKGK